MSSNDMPELGSKISLISKADIRYEGKLYAVDPQDCTIALANVKSFGTEDRKTANPVLAQKQIYDYILFRATDIKDISVVPAPQQLLYDPAIVQLSAPPNLGSRYGAASSSSSGNAGASGDPTSYSHPVLGNLGHQPFSSAPGSGTSTSAGFNPMHSGLHNLARPSPSEFLHHHNNDLLTGSRSSTPALRKPSPTVDQATQANTPQQRRLTNSSPQHQQKDRNQQQSVYYRTGNRNQDNRNQGNMRNNQQSYQQQRQRTFSQQRGDHQHQHQQQQHQQGRGGWGGQQQQQRTGGTGGTGNLANRQRSTTGRVHQRGGANFSRAPGTGAARKSATPLKFESDYDFDKANTEFEELFAKMKIGKSQEGLVDGNASSAAAVVNGGQEKSKDDSGHEIGVLPEGGDANNSGDSSNDQVVFYNKTKSFFDNISCEAVERSKGRSQRTDWRKERKLNSETFGVSSARRGMFGRGGPRGGAGGGYYYGRGAGGYYGSRGGYRPGAGTLFKQQNKTPYRSQQQPQVAKA